MNSFWFVLLCVIIPLWLIIFLIKHFGNGGDKNNAR